MSWNADIRRGSGIATVAVAAWLLASAPALPAARMEATVGDGGARLSLTWDAAVSVASERDGRELTLRFNRPLGDLPLDTVPGRLPGWVENTAFGYDSVLLVLPSGVDAMVVKDGAAVRVDFVRAAAVSRPPADVAAERVAERQAERRLDYFRAVTDLEDGDLHQARARARALVDTDPKDVSSLVLLGNAEERAGRWREALDVYDRALTLTPDEPSLLRSRQTLFREHGDQVRLDVDLFQVEDADTQRIARLSARQDLGGHRSLVALIETRRVDTDQVVRADGRITPFHGWRTRGEVTVAQDWDDGHRTTASLFAAERTLGAGLIHSMRTDIGVTRAGILASEPAYTFVEGIVGAGRRDRAFLQHEFRLGEGWSAMLGGGFSRYGLDENDDLARSTTAEGALRYAVDLGRPVASIGYSLDAEYVIERETRIDPLGNPYAPLPVATREVHSFSLGIDDEIGDVLRYGVQGGYAYDRRNSGGPFAAVTVAYEPLTAVEMGFRASHARSTARGSDAGVNAVGVYFALRN